MKRLVSRFAMLFGIALLFIFLIFWEMLFAPIMLLLTLLLGWWPSMMRLIGAWHPGPGGIALFVFAAVLLVAGSHSFLRWLYASLRHGKESRWPAKWRWKWTVCGFAMLACAQVAICSLVLTTHQIYWISKSSDPLFADPRYRNGVRDMAMDLQKEADLLHWDSAKTRESFLQNDSAGSGQPAAETIQPVWIEKDDHSLRAIILIPRRPLFRASAWVSVLQPGTNVANYQLDELPQVLASFGIGSLAQKSSRATPLLP